MSHTIRASVLASNAADLMSACSGPIDGITSASQATWEIDIYRTIKKAR